MRRNADAPELMVKRAPARRGRETYQPGNQSRPRRARGATSGAIKRAAVRQRGRIDTVQPGIVKALRDLGASVAVTSSLGRGFPDLVVGWRGRNTLLECKTGNANLTGDEADFQMRWAGQITIVRTVEEAVLAVMANSK